MVLLLLSGPECTNQCTSLILMRKLMQQADPSAAESLSRTLIPAPDHGDAESCPVPVS